MVGLGLSKGKFSLSVWSVRVTCDAADSAFLYMDLSKLLASVLVS